MCFEISFLCVALPDCPETCSVDQTGLKLRDRRVSASCKLGLKQCATSVRFLFVWLVLFLETCGPYLRIKAVCHSGQVPFCLSCFVFNEVGSLLSPLLRDLLA